MGKQQDVLIGKLYWRKRELRAGAILLTLLVVLAISLVGQPVAHAQEVLQSPVHMDYTVSLGSVLTIVAMLGGLFTFYVKFAGRMDADINGLGDRITKIEEKIGPVVKWWEMRMQRLETEHDQREHRGFGDSR